MDGPGSNPERRHSRILRGSPAYDDTKRFRIWKLAVHDLLRLGCGYRAYHAQALTDLTLAVKVGWKFLNPNGSEVNVELLKADDLYGFLGKSKHSPDGPQRRLSDPKMRVLELYLLYRYPVSAAAVRAELDGYDMAMANVEYIFGQENNVKVEAAKNLLSQIETTHLFISRTKYAGSWRTNYEPTHYHHQIVSVSVHGFSGAAFCNVIKATAPLRIKDLNNNSPLVDAINWDRQEGYTKSSPETIIYKGVAFPIYIDTHIRDDIKLVGIAKDVRTGWHDYLQFEAHRSEKGVAATSRFNFHDEEDSRISSIEEIIKYPNETDLNLQRVLEINELHKKIWSGI